MCYVAQINVSELRMCYVVHILCCACIYYALVLGLLQYFLGKVLHLNSYPTCVIVEDYSNGPCVGVGLYIGIL